MSNEEILKLRILLYGLKLRALNAQILSANSGSFAVSYGVVATEIIHFNQKLQETNDKLSEKIAIVLKATSRIQRISHINGLISLSLEKSKARNNDIQHYQPIRRRSEQRITDLHELESEIKKIFSEIRILIRNSIKLCLEGRSVSLQTRIESATITENQKLFLAVAESFDSALNIIESSYRYLVKVW
ncbi:hypothetical protein [Leptospira ognonensis]|nr:hypothetical protein [Leptospira ognonensis]